jgi:hypothetical protein
MKILEKSPKRIKSQNTRKGKGKVVSVLNYAPRHERSGGIAPRILDLSTRWMVSFTTRPLYLQGKSPSYPLDRRLGVPQSRFGRGDEEKNSQPLPGLEPPNTQPVA